jgi:hypothetical protein
VAATRRPLSLQWGETLSPQLQAALAPLLSALETITARIREYDAQIEKLAEESYPEVALPKQVKGVGTLIALTYILTLEDPRRFQKSRDAGCYVGLQPGRRNSGESERQLHITREGDSYLRMVLVQGAQHILGPFGEDSDLRRWGLKLAERGGRNGKKRAIVAVARKLAVLLHHLWISCEAYEPLHNSRKRRLAANPAGMPAPERNHVQVVRCKGIGCGRNLPTPVEVRVRTGSITVLCPICLERRSYIVSSLPGNTRAWCDCVPEPNATKSQIDQKSCDQIRPALNTTAE